MKNVLLWLDDMRNPYEGNWIAEFSPLKGGYSIYWVKSYDRFIQWINNNGLPRAICFDHDLGEDEAKAKVAKGVSKKKARQEKKLAKSGMDCAKWLVDYCIDHDLDLPEWNVQSSNEPGKDNINGLLSGYLKFRLDNPK